MKEIFKKDISERREFTFSGDTLKFKEYVPDFNKYLYERYSNSGRLVGYEVVIPVRHKNPDGTIINVYPCSEQFGKYGWELPARSTQAEIDEILRCPGNPFGKK